MSEAPKTSWFAVTTVGVSIIVRRMVKDSGVTEDLCQETFRLVLEKIRRGEVREAEKLSGFICSLARNLALDHFRQIRRQSAVNRCLLGKHRDTDKSAANSKDSEDRDDSFHRGAPEKCNCAVEGVWPKDIPFLAWGEVSADRWFERDSSEKYYIQESSFRTGNDSVTVMLWWEDEQQLIDIEEDEERRQSRCSDYSDVF